MEPKVYEFGAFRLNCSEKCLYQDGRPVNLTPKAVEILILLVGQAGELASKEVLIEKVWPGTFVEENNLSQQISALRKTLGDPEAIETVPRLGFRFRLPVKTRASAPPGQRVWARRSWLALPLAGLGAATWWVLRKPQRQSSIAVLPFLNLTGTSENDFLCDGLTEQVIDGLAKVQGLHVLARTSSFQYRGQRVDIRELGRRLGVEWILEGSVRRQGDTLRVTAQLIRAADAMHLWSETFEQPVADLYQLQDYVAERVVLQIHAKRIPQGKPRTAPNSEAYLAYLRGRNAWNQGLSKGYQDAIRYFEEAIRRQPDFAAAYAGLADTYWRSALWESALPEDSYGRARKAVETALELDPTAPEAHASKGQILLNYDFKFADAERSLKRALELDPVNANAHHWLSHVMIPQSRWQESRAYSETALRYDPDDAGIRNHMGWHLYHAGQFKEGRQWTERVLEWRPKHVGAHHFLALIQIELADLRSAAALLKRSLELSGPNPERQGTLGYVMGRLGNSVAAREVRRELEQDSLKRYVSPRSFALIALGLGEIEEAFRQLAMAGEQRSNLMVNFRVDPLFASLRSDQRFNQIVRRCGLNIRE
jgi:TolB-like protein/DNA-binding winged helix-turn-helix (wHTH) protein/Flp pilus assembly protein TadD